MADRPPACVRSLLEQRLQGHGMGISDLAAMSDLVHKEAFTETDRFDTFLIETLLTTLRAAWHAEAATPIMADRPPAVVARGKAART